MIMPVQWVSVMSQSSSRPQLMVPSPTPFWPCSSSSRRRKLRGTTTAPPARQRPARVSLENAFNRSHLLLTSRAYLINTGLLCSQVTRSPHSRESQHLDLLLDVNKHWSHTCSPFESREALHWARVNPPSKLIGVRIIRQA